MQLGLFLQAPPLLAQAPVTPGSSALVASNGEAMAQLQMGLQLYGAQRYGEAAQVLQQAIATSGGDPIVQALAQNVLSLVYQKLDRWSEAESAVEIGLTTIAIPSLDRPDLPLIKAKLLNTRGQLLLKTGRAELALQDWKQATLLYAQAGDTEGVTLASINQAQALQTLGFYDRALEKLTEVYQVLEKQPDSVTKGVALRSLGNTLRAAGDLQLSKQVLTQSLTILKALNSDPLVAETLLSLGNTTRALQNHATALTSYQQAAELSPVPATQVQARLNQFSLLLEKEQWSDALAMVLPLQTQLRDLPASRQAIYARINFVQNLERLRQVLEVAQSPAIPSWSTLLQFAQATVKQAQELGDQRAETFAIGSLGHLYEQMQDWRSAKQLTQQALLQAQAIQARDITYRWQWQAGRLAQATGETTVAIAAYSEAVKTLNTLRSDLVSMNPDVQFSFRDSVEPIYRELVSLLLQPGPETSQQNLNQARTAIESLQMAELEDFFRQACLEGVPAQIDQVDRSAAVIYPILLNDRIEVIFSLAKQPLRHYATAVPRETIEATLKSLRVSLSNQNSLEYFEIAQEVYNWLIKPVEQDLKVQNIKTLVFVLDGPMRNVPMAALFDGQNYLIEKYAVAVAPGLQLVDLKPLQREKIKVLAAGVSEASQGFTPLPSVQAEIAKIQSNIPSEVLLNNNFTVKNFQQELQTSNAPVVHLATHGEFSSRADRTFILTWDERLNVTQLTDLLRTRQGQQQTVIELLVLSACRTAVGDRRAALGLAGVAVRAGARSTLGTLWYVSDEATSSLMIQFYQEFSGGRLNKSEALRQAQLSLLKVPEHEHPFFWAPYILVGNWL
ncbi:hypothetical protein BST81_15850 [Leptolyngbya sp. 'hensonii']|nr:hypothetical protein BST81_15850 [Leptolyngbya sp. 'hensonii']